MPDASSHPLAALELCAGGGGQALGVELAGFTSAAAVEIDEQACATLRLNRPSWNVIQSDVRSINGHDYRGIDLLAAGVPCPPFSVAGKQLGASDERDLFPEAVRLITEAKPPAIMLENVAGFAAAKFSAYRTELFTKIEKLGYCTEWKLLNASNFGVPQLRPRFVLVALQRKYFERFEWPTPIVSEATVGTVLQDLMAANRWQGALRWVGRANGIAPTVVGGSKKHGGPDLGPTRAKAQWRTLAVDGLGIADSAPGPEFPLDGFPRLTVRMVARIQSFPDSWQFSGRKTASYRQVGNAFPPLVAQAVATAIRCALTGESVAEPRTANGRLFETPSIWKSRPPARRAPVKKSSITSSKTLAG